jgi:hypothetical protein
MEESIERTPANLKKNLRAKLSNAPKSLESCYVGLKFQFEKLDLWIL